MSARKEVAEPLQRPRPVKGGGIQIVTRDRPTLLVAPSETPDRSPRARNKGTLTQRTQLELLQVAEEIGRTPAIAANSLSYMANVLVRVTLPHKAQPGQNEFSREAHNLLLSIIAPRTIGLPYGAIPRVALSWITTEAVRTKSRQLELGTSFSQFMQKLGYVGRGGGARGMHTRVRDQLVRLLSSTIILKRDAAGSRSGINMPVAATHVLWWDPKEPNQQTLWQSNIVLGKEFFDEVVNNLVPVDMRALRGLSDSPLALDVYCWATHRAFAIREPLFLPWLSLQMQFGTGYPLTPAGTRAFRYAFRVALRKVLVVYPELRVDADRSDVMIVKPSPAHIPSEPLTKALALK